MNKNNNIIKDLAEKIARDFHLTIKQRTDQLLQLSATCHSNLGSDSTCLLYTSPSPRDRTRSRMPSSA